MALVKKQVKVLIVDDDPDLRTTIAEILRTNGYGTLEAETGKDAIEKIKSNKVRVALIDIRLPDMEGTEVLSTVRKINPTIIAIMVTGYPSLDNASLSLNFGAASYFVKPFNLDQLLETIRERLQEQDKILKGSTVDQAKLRLRSSQLGEYEDFSETLASKLMLFGLSKTQAKVYLAANVLGSALASEIAELSGIRREEVYRAIPVLRRKGLIVSKFSGHKKFSALEPASALANLTKTRIAGLKKEAHEILETKKQILDILEKAFFEFETDSYIEPVYQHEHLEERLVNAIKKAQKSISIAVSTGDLEFNIVRSISRQAGSLNNNVEVRLILEKSSIKEDAKEDHFDWLRAINKGFDKVAHIEIRGISYLPFKSVIVDNSEAVWGNFMSEGNFKVFWTNDFMQLNILTTAFERLWWASQPL